MKTSRAAVALLLSLALASCTSGMFPPGSDPPSDLATAQAGMRTQAPGADAPPATPPPDLLASRTAFLSSELGIQFSYPDNWYLRESPSSQPRAVVVSSFDPANPPHKSDWNDQATMLTFTFKVLLSPPSSFEAWVESARQDALASQLSIFAEERLEIAGQPAARLTLVAGSGGILHQVLTDLGGRYYEIAVEGNLDAARPVLESIQPFVAAGLKPPDHAMPTSGICSDPQVDPVPLTLGLGPDLIPMAGRCLAVSPSQRIRLVNQSGDPFSLVFAGYSIHLPVGGALLLDRPVGEYLAEGVHFLPMGPELRVRPAVAEATPVATMPGPYGHYSNPEVGYSLTLAGWSVDEHGLANANREVIFYPGDAEPFVTYLSVSLETRTLDQVTTLYAQSVPEALREEAEFNGNWAVRYTYGWGRIEYFVPHGDRLVLIATDRPTDGVVQMMLGSLQFTPVTMSRFVDRELGYSLAVPSGWVVDEGGRTATTREIRFYPVPAEPFVAYLDIGIDPRSLDAIRSQPFHDAQKVEIVFAGQSGVHVLYTGGRSEMYLPYRGRVYYLISDRPADEDVQRMIGSFAFLP